MEDLEHTRKRGQEKPADSRLRARTLLERWLPIMILSLGLIFWEILVRFHIIPSLFFPAPSEIGRAFIKVVRNGKLPLHTGATLFRTLIGATIGIVPAILLGLMMGWSPRLRTVIDPLVAAVHPIPKIAFLPLIMIIFGVGESSKMVVVAVAAFFPMLINTITGVRQIHPIHFEVAQNYGASMSKIFTRIVVPGSLPLLLAGIRLAFNIALLITIAVELTTAQTGLGHMIWFSWETMRIEELYISLVVIAAFGIGFNIGLQFLTRHLIPWRVPLEEGLEE